MTVVLEYSVNDIEGHKANNEKKKKKNIKILFLKK